MWVECHLPQRRPRALLVATCDARGHLGRLYARYRVNVQTMMMSRPDADVVRDLPAARGRCRRRGATGRRLVGRGEKLAYVHWMKDSGPPLVARRLDEGQRTWPARRARLLKRARFGRAFAQDKLCPARKLWRLIAHLHCAKQAGDVGIRFVGSDLAVFGAEFAIGPTA